MRVAWPLLVAAVLVLTGCAGAGARGPSLPNATPIAFAEAPPGAGAPAQAELASWWARFDDPVLTGLVERAFAANLDLSQTAARIQEARQLEIVAGARRLPQVNASASASENRISEHAIPVPPGAGTRPGQVSPFGVPGSEFSSFRLGADASWELDLFGAAANTARAARARREAAEWSGRDLKVALAAEIASHYLNLRALQQRRAAAGEELQRQRALLEILRARAQAGFVGGLEIGQQEALARASEARLAPLEAGARAEIHALGVLVGEGPGALVATLAAPAALPAAPPAPPPGLPSDLLRRRPDIRRAEREVAAAAADVGVATADLYPKITLSAQPALVSTALANLVEWGSRNYTFSAGLLWPIFDGGRLRAQLGAADARQAQALLGYRKAVLKGLQDVEDALSRYQADEARAQALEASLASARSAEAVARDQHRSGVLAWASVLQAQQAVISGQDELAQARAARAQDLVALYRALGGGWSEDDLQEKRS